MIRKKKNLISDEREIVSLCPRKLVSHFYNKVSVGSAAVVILFAVILETILLAIFGVPKIFTNLILSLISSYVISWVIVGAVLFIILYIVKGNTKVSKKDFNHILSGLAAFKIINIFAMLFIAIVVMIFIPKIVPFISSIFTNPAIMYSATALPAIAGWGIVGLVLLAILSIAVIIYYILMTYFLVENMYKYKNIGTNIILMIIILVIMWLLSLII